MQNVCLYICGGIASTNFVYMRLAQCEVPAALGFDTCDTALYITAARSISYLNHNTLCHAFVEVHKREDIYQTQSTKQSATVNTLAHHI